MGLYLQKLDCQINVNFAGPSHKHFYCLKIIAETYRFFCSILGRYRGVEYNYFLMPACIFIGGSRVSRQGLTFNICSDINDIGFTLNVVDFLMGLKIQAKNTIGV